MKNVKFWKKNIVVLCTLLLACAISFIYNQPSPVSALSYNFTEITTSLKAMPEGETMTVINNVFIFRFQDETNNLNTVPSGYGEASLTVREIIENGYKDSSDGGSEYSLSSYYKAISNGRLNVQNKFYYSSISGDSYEPYVITLDRDTTISYAQGYSALFTRIYNYVKNALPTAAEDLDANDDGYVDALSFIFIPSTVEVTNRASCMWPHKSSSSQYYSSTVSVNGESLKLGNYQLMTAEVLLDKFAYLVDDNGVKIADVATNIHEFGHVLGFPDLYIYDDIDLCPVGIWDVMGYNYYRTAQQMLAYNALEGGLLLESNAREITANGDYTLKPLAEVKSSTDIATFYIRGQGDYSNQYFYIEYRKGGLYDGQIYNGGLIVYRIDEDVKPSSGRSDSVTAGNYNAPPTAIEVFKNSLDAGDTTSADFQNITKIVGYRCPALEGEGAYYYSTISSNETLSSYLAPIMPITESNRNYEEPMGINKIGYSLSASPTTQNIVYTRGQTDINYSMTTAPITYQVYDSSKRQDQLTEADVGYENTGIEIEALQINADGSITFSVNWSELEPKDTEAPIVELSCARNISLSTNELFDISSKITLSDNGEAIDYTITNSPLTDSDLEKLSIVYYIKNGTDYELTTPITEWTTAGEFKIVVQAVDASGNKSLAHEIFITVTQKTVGISLTEGDTLTFVYGSQEVSSFDIYSYFKTYISGVEYNGFGKIYEPLQSIDRNKLSVVSYSRKTGVYTKLSSPPTSLIKLMQYKFEIQAVDGDGNFSEVKTIVVKVLAQNSISRTDFNNDSLYDALKAKFSTKFDTSVFPLYKNMFVEYYNSNLTDLSSNDITSLENLDMFDFNSSMVLDFSSNKLNLSTISSSLNRLLDKDVKVVALFNNIMLDSKPQNLYLGVQNIKSFYLNTAPEDEFRNYADYGNFLHYEFITQTTTAYSANLTPGTYTLKYSCSTPSFDRSFTFTYATIALEKGEAQELEAGKKFVYDNVLFKGVESSDYKLERNTGTINVDRVTIGDYVTTYTVKEISTNNTIIVLTQTVICRDTIAPTIDFKGSATMYIYFYSGYVEQGMNISDSYDPNPTLIKTIYLNDEVVSRVDTSKVGQYKIVYSAKDASGNISSTKTRLVNIIYRPVDNVEISLGDFQVPKVGQNIDFVINKTNSYNKVDPNTVTKLYIDNEFIGDYIGDRVSYSFNKTGEHDVYVEVVSMYADGVERTLSSQHITVEVLEKTFIEKYGLIIIAGVAGTIIVCLIIYFAVRKKRDMF